MTPEQEFQLANDPNNLLGKNREVFIGNQALRLKHDYETRIKELEDLVKKQDVMIKDLQCNLSSEKCRVDFFSKKTSELSKRITDLDNLYNKSDGEYTLEEMLAFLLKNERESYKFIQENQHKINDYDSILSSLNSLKYLVDEKNKEIEKLISNSEGNKEELSIEEIEKNLKASQIFIQGYDAKTPDKDLKEAWEKLFEYIKSTCSDKYADPNAIISTKKAVIHGKVKQVNTFNAAKYLARYDTTGYEKSENEKDLFKAIHYLIFEIQRKINNSKNEQTNI